MLDRRAFTRGAAGLAGAFALAGVRAQDAAPVDGRDFLSLDKPFAMPANGKIEVAEFFWYGCPHCFAFEPAIAPWIAQLPADVHFSRVPVGFDVRRQVHQRIFYTWEALGVADQMHIKTFMHFHVQRKPIDSLDDMVAFAQQNGLDADKVRAAWNGFSVQSRCLAAQRLEDAYDIQNTPEMAVAGRFTATAREGAGRYALLSTTDWLVNRVRHGG